MAAQTGAFVLYREKPGVLRDREEMEKFESRTAAIEYIRKHDALVLKQGPGVEIGRDTRTGWALALRSEVADER